MKNDSDKITEQKYIELGEDFKELMTVKDNEIIQLKKIILSKKLLLNKTYGIISFCTEIFENTDNMGINGQTMHHMLDYLENQIFLELKL
tara:strand:- start:7470 stop:7739 length:270 start_codon:yes stop_codon:yes gene_type:complete